MSYDDPHDYDGYENDFNSSPEEDYSESQSGWDEDSASSYTSYSSHAPIKTYSRDWSKEKALAILIIILIVGLYFLFAYAACDQNIVTWFHYLLHGRIFCAF